jgi:succinyl-diaminopimelate desuccinylase
MNLKSYLDEHKQERLNQLFELLKFPSVSAKSENKKDILACADWLAKHLNDIGIKSSVLPTAGHPLVYGEHISSADKLTVLYYGHYDVQPPEPFELWNSEPFDPLIKDGFMYARGATDDKGQLMTHIKAVEAYLATGTKLPINVKFIFEGEEESAAENLAEFVKENKDMLSADIIVVSDGSQLGKNQPAVTFGLRGVAMVELKITGPDRDLHSGGYGGAVPNPIVVLSKIISSFHDADNHINIDGFYDDVQPISDWEKQEFARLPFNIKDFASKLGLKGLCGEKGFTVYEQLWSRPTVEINGITGGYQGEGGKTIVPSWASCKITTRLVPNQDAKDIMDKLEAHIRKVCPDYVECQVDKHGGAGAVTVPTEGPWLEAAGKAVETGFGIKPVFKKEGGSIPIVGTFKEVLGLDTLLIGWGQNDDNAHSPNERFSLEDFERGTYSALALIEELAKVRE